MHRRLAAAATLGLTLLLAACTDDAPKPPPPPTPGPTMPSETPSPSPSPTQSQDDVDKAAVEKAYREQFAEYNRLEIAGGTTRPTQVLLDTTSGQHRSHFLTFLRNDKKNGVRQTKAGVLVGVVAGSISGSTAHVVACEDYSQTSWVKADGSKLKVKQPIRYLQRATAKKGKDKRWRIDYVETTNVKRFNRKTCGGS